tara:strand:+ start:77 stop:751 length:675 start_codon:yes stop_codon:yes gene_type:complete
MNKVELKINWATHESSKYACLNWHYSKCLPVGKLVKIGVWENKKFIGVVLFSRGACKHLGDFIKLDQTQVCELTRVALNKHKSPVSKIISIALKFLKKINPNMKLIVSYADQTQGHHGGIYQAGNWIYVGTGGGNTFFMIKGKLTHPRSLGATTFSPNKKREAKFKGLSVIQRAKTIDPLAYSVKVKGKHKYMMPLDKNIKNDILKLSKPYPKRVKQAMNDDQS